jgi:hypothetical protein
LAFSGSGFSAFNLSASILAILSENGSDFTIAARGQEK